MLEPNETYARIQSVRIKNLEQQVKILQRELQRIREGILSQNDVVRLGSLMEKLRELNFMLTDLRNRYNYMLESSLKQRASFPHTQKSWSDYRHLVPPKDTIKQNVEKHLENQHNPVKMNGIEKRFEKIENVTGQSKNEWNDNQNKSHKRENAGYDHVEKVPENSKYPERQSTDVRNDLKETFKTCKQLMDDIKPPGSILGNYLLRLQDFRTDPELRLQRWERKQQEKLKQNQRRERLKENLAGNKNDVIQESGYLSSSFISTETKNDHKDLVKVSTSLVSNLPVIEENLSEVVYGTISDIEKHRVALTIVQENDHLYHINVSIISNGRSLACFLATEEAVQEAEKLHLFQDLLTFFIVNAKNSRAQKNRILGHLFEFVKIDGQ